MFPPNKIITTDQKLMCPTKYTPTRFNWNFLIVYSKAKLKCIGDKESWLRYF